jgi:hypothetical protein
MVCLQCGNCSGTDLLYYCTAQNDFVIREQAPVLPEMARESSRWKKGDPEYEVHRRKIRKEKMLG